jgi:PAS domain S-box-containing protein
MTLNNGYGGKEPIGVEGRDAILSLLEASQSAFIALDSSFGVTSWSHAAEEIFGWNTKEIVGRKISLLAPDGSLERCLAVIRNGRGEHFESCCRTKFGQAIFVDVWARLLSSTNQRYLLVRDATECKFLEHAFLDASEREQRRIGREMHDYLCQHILGAAFAVKALAGDLDREGSRHAEKLHDLARLVNEAVTQVRDISRGLHPVELECDGLPAALQGLASRVSRTVPCEFYCDENPVLEPSDPALQAYRIAQEAVDHALQETGATKISIRLSEKDDSLRLEIADNGTKEGPLTTNPNHLVSKTLLYRARAIHGELQVNFHDGTHISCTFPHP